MADVRTNSANAFETVLTAEMGPTALVASLEAVLGLSVPTYLTFDPENALAHREYLFFDGAISGTDISTTALANRYLSGSVASSGITHPVGTVVRMTPTKQQFDDLHDRVDGRMSTGSHTKSVHDALGIGHASLSGLANDDHPQYHTDARGDARYLRQVGGTLTGRLTTAGIRQRFDPADFNVAPASYPEGVSIGNTGAALAGGPAGLGAGTILTVKYADTSIYQEVSNRASSTATVPRHWYRFGYQGATPAWSPWREIFPTQGGELYGFAERLNNLETVSGTVTLDFSQYSAYRVVPGGNITIAFAGLSGATAAGLNPVRSMTLIVTNSTYALAWPAGTRFAGGAAPALEGETWISIVARGGIVTVGNAWTGVA